MVPPKLLPFAQPGRRRAASARPPLSRRRAWWRLAPLVAALALAAWPAPARAGELAKSIYAIEAAYGNDPDAVIARLRPLEAGARATGGDDLRAFLAAWGFAHDCVDKPAVAEAAFEELIDIGERTHAPAALASAYTLKASMLEDAGQIRAAFGWSQSAVPLARQAADPDLNYWVAMVAGDLADANGQLDEGIAEFQYAVQDARAARNPRREAQATLALTPLHIVQGQTELALREAARVRELMANSTDRGLVVSGWIMESFAAAADGQADRSLHARQQAIEAQRDATHDGAAPGASSPATANSYLGSELDALLDFSSLHLSSRTYAPARQFAERARDVADSRHDPDGHARALIALGLADLGLGHLQLGRQEADTGLSLLEHHKRDAQLLIELNRYSEMLEHAGDRAAALARLREALLLENELARHDHHSTVVELQRQSSFEQHQRQVEQLEHENALQAVEISRRARERGFTFALLAVLGVGAIGAGHLYLLARRSNHQLARNNAQLEFTSLHDKVTGLLNRRAMEADTGAIERAQNGSYCNVTISVKQFGLIVGSVGYQLGDTLLCQIAARLEQVMLRHDGRLYRVDGVTFGALFRFGRDEPRLRGILEAMCAAMEAPFAIGNQDLIVSIGAGASEYPKDAGSAQEVARLAELAKLESHADPGNGWLIYDTRLGESQRDKLTMETRLLKALEHGDFELFYQGLHGLTDGRICGFEALLRWRDGDEMVSPADFIPLAEETGLIVRIGAWVLAEACRQAKAWADAGMGKPLVAVNISPRQFNHPDFLATVRETLHATGVDPRQIELEITEGSVMNDAESSIAQLHALRALGLHLAIDDFGTGYASLSYLRRFPLDRLKIDRSFVRQLNTSEQDDTIVRTVIELAHTLGLAVTAEGVETVEQEAVLERWGCDVIQGFLHFRPAPALTATSQLRQDAQAATTEAAA